MAARRSARQRGQILVQLVLILTPLLAIVGLSLSSALLMHTKTRFDQSALSAAVGAAGDACMASPYGFDLYECTAGAGTLGMYTTYNINPPPAGPNATQVNNEHTIAQTSADATVSKILAYDYPAPFVVQPCTVPNCASQVTNTHTVVYQVQVSCWYMYDYNDSSDPNCLTALASDDAPNITSPDGGFFVANGDESGSLVCPAIDLSPYGAHQFARKVTVSMWVQSTPPFGSFLGNVGSVPLTTTETAFGCARS